MATATMDTELLQLKTDARVASVLSFYESGLPVDWDTVEYDVANAVRDLKQRRLVEPWRQMGFNMRKLIDQLNAMGAAFASGYAEGPQ